MKQTMADSFIVEINLHRLSEPAVMDKTPELCIRHVWLAFLN